MSNIEGRVPFQLEQCRLGSAGHHCSATLIKEGKGVLACGRDCWEYPSATQALAAWFEIVSNPTATVPPGWTRHYTR